MKLLNYFIDELGSANPKSIQSKLYILSGILVASYAREALKIKADQIKFKYWNRTNIVFHSREIGRKEGDFAILKNNEINQNFTKDLMMFLDQGNFQLFGVIVDKSKLPKNWNEKTLYKKTSLIIIRNFLCALLAQNNVRGRLIIESATAEKDFYYHKTVGHFLSNGFKELKISYQHIQDVLTEISYVTKKNFDIEEQLADILAYGLRVKYESQEKKDLSNYETELVIIVNKKLFSMHPNTGVKKKRLYSQIKSFAVIP